MSKNVLITGAGGEVGQSLLANLSQKGNFKITAIDIAKPVDELAQKVSSFVVGDICDRQLLKEIFDHNSFNTIFHLAAILSTSAEKNPEKAHGANIQGTLNLLDLCFKADKDVRFIFPSSIAVYGLPDIKAKNVAAPLKESEYLNPITIYGISKLHCEMLGKYYSKYYKLLDSQVGRKIDFRCVRFPGLISATTLPTGGTTDYAPEMIHAAAQGKDYECFVRPDSILPFMAMPDGVKALINISEAKKENVKRSVYNIASFSVSASQIEKEVLKYFPSVSIKFKPHILRQKIVDSWPKEVDDTQARRDWAWKPSYDFTKTFEEYLIPTIKKRYK